MATNPIDARELELTMDNTEPLWLAKEQLRRARAPYQTWVEFLTDHVLRQAVANGGTVDDSTHHAIKRLADGLTWTVADTLQAMGTLTTTDTTCILRGYACGNYAAAYETEDYNAAVAAINGTNGFYRVGHLLGFYSSFELHEILDPTVRAEVEHYRAVVAALDIGLEANDMTDTRKDITDWAEEFAEQQWARCGPGLAPLTEMRLEAGTDCTDYIEARMGIHLADYEQDMAADAYQSWTEDYLTERVNDVLRGLPLPSRGIYPFAIVSATPHGWRCRLSFSRYHRIAVELNQVQAALDSAVQEAS